MAIGIGKMVIFNGEMGNGEVGNGEMGINRQR
jgi:hypothetical protein